MIQERAQPIESGSPSEIAIQIFDNGKPIDILRALLPQGFPPELGHHLADFMALGFNAAHERQLSLEEFAEPLQLRGRPIDSDVQRMGQEAARLHRRGLTYGQIASKLCLERQSDPRHRCDKKCADRIRQAAQPYMKAAKRR